MRQIKAAFEVLTAPCFRKSATTARGCEHGPNLWQEHHHEADDALRGCSKSKRQNTSIWDRWQRDETFREAQLVHECSDAWVRYLDHIAKSDISHTAPHSQRESNNNLHYLRSVNESKQAPPLPQRRGYQDAKKALVDMKKQVRQECVIPWISKVERQRLHYQLDPSMQRYLEWLGTNWAEYFAEERSQPSSSSSWTPSSSWWTTSSWTSDWDQHEWKDSTSSEKW